jgi:zinc protease
MKPLPWLDSLLPRVAPLLLAACGAPLSNEPTASAGPPTEAGGTSQAAVAPAPAITQTATPQELVFPQGEAFRSQQPEAGAPRPFQLPKVKPFTLQNGLQVFLVEQHSLPLVSLDLNFDAGSVLDPKGQAGLVSICTSMLTEGTERLDKIQYAEALADVASTIATYTTDDTSGLTLSSLSKHLDPTFALFTEALRVPGFRGTDFERLVKRRIESVRQSKGSPATVASRVTNRVLYGAAHPFGAVVTEQTLGALGIEDCKQFVAARLKPRGARLFVVGDLTEAQIRAYFAQAELASWKGTPATLPAMPAPQTLAGRIHFVHVPGAAQSQVSFMHFGPKRSAPDYFANTIMAAVFGGGFSSRINMNLREAKGYSYGARGGFNYSRQYGVFEASASVRTDSTYQTVLEIEHELKDLAAGARPVTPEELDREKQGAIFSLPGQFATYDAALSNYRRLVYFNLPLDYFNHYVDNVRHVSRPQVLASAAKRLEPAKGVYLIVGDGDAPALIRDIASGQDIPYLADGRPLTLRQALVSLAQRGDLGPGGLVELDTDGVPRG